MRSGRTGSSSGGSGSNSGGNRGGEDKTSKYCKPGCPDAWIGDKYCDRACRNLECGYDAGDCEISELFREMQGYAVLPNTTLIEVPQGLPAVYFNLSGVVEQHKITDGSHDNAVLVRTATISQKHKLMTLTFHHNTPRQSVAISVSHETAKDHSVDFTFNCTADSRPLPSAADNATALNATDAVSSSNSTDAAAANTTSTANATVISAGNVSSNSTASNATSTGPVGTLSNVSPIDPAPIPVQHHPFPLAPPYAPPYA